MKKSKISKRDSITEHLDLAIQLFFLDKYSISSHLLASAAYEMLSDLYDKNKNDQSLNKLIGLKLPKDRRKVVFDLLKEEYHYIKHARNNDDEFIELNHEKTESLLAYSVLVYYLELFGELTVNMTAFKIWTLVQNPELSTNTFKANIDKLADFKLSSMDKQSYLSFIKKLNEPL